MRININICICQYHTTIFCITHNFNIRRLITCFHRNRYYISSFEPTAIKLRTELLISSILLLKCLLINVIIKRNRRAHFLDVGTSHLLNGRISIITRHYHEATTILIGFLQEYLLTCSKGSWHDISVFRLIRPKLLLQGITIAIISMLQSIINAFLGILSLSILTHGILLCWSH